METENNVSKKSILFLAIVIIVFLGVWWMNKKPEVVSLVNSLGSVQPLIIKADLANLTADQEKEIADFRKLILDRVKSKTPLTEIEKNVIGASIIEKERRIEAIDAVVVDQSTYKFTEQELKMIQEALK